LIFLKFRKICTSTPASNYGKYSVNVHDVERWADG
jgi:hypothetical protein